MPHAPTSLRPANTAGSLLALAVAVPLLAATALTAEVTLETAAPIADTARPIASISQTLDAAVGDRIVLPALDAADAAAIPGLAADGRIGVISRIVQPGLGRVIVTGFIEGESFSTFSIARSEHAIAGHLRLGATGVWKVAGAAGDDFVATRHVDPGPPCTVEHARPTGRPEIAGGATEGFGGDVDDGSVIDVLIVFPPSLTSDLGGIPEVMAQLDLAIEDTNIAFLDSEVPTSVRLVHAEEFIGPEPSLSALRNMDDGIYDAVHPLRDAYAADQVALVRPGGGGSAFGLDSFDKTEDENAFSQNGINSFGGYVLTHEIGHNLGCCHSVGDGGGCGVGLLFEYSNGWRWDGDSGTLWRTVMSYSPGSRLLRFSNPDILWDGVPTGVNPSEGEVGANNASTIVDSAFFVANHRVSSDAPCFGLDLPPDAPDCDGNDLPDACEIAAGLAPDTDGDGILDVCDCTGDFDGDETVGLVDLLTLLSQWGGDCSSFCAGDLDLDGDVDTTDLVSLLAAWGACP